MYKVVVKKDGIIIAKVEVTGEEAQKLLNKKETARKETPIEEMDLTVRSYNALRRNGVDTVEKLLQMKEPEQLMKIRGLGRKGYEEILEKAREYDKTFMLMPLIPVTEFADILE